MSAAGPVRVGLIGAGRMGRRHLVALERATGTEVAGVVDPVREARAAVAARGHATYERPGEMLEQGAVDAVVIVAPSDLHRARLNELWFGDGAEPGELYGMRRIRAEHPSHPETEGWWAIGQGVGYGASFVNQAAHVLANWPDGAWDPDLEVGLRVQAVTEAIERAAASGPLGGGERGAHPGLVLALLLGLLIPALAIADAVAHLPLA